MAIHVHEAMAKACDWLVESFTHVHEIHRDALPAAFRRPERPARTGEWVRALPDDENSALLVADRGPAAAQLLVRNQ